PVSPVPPVPPVSPVPLVGGSQSPSSQFSAAQSKRDWHRPSPSQTSGRHCPVQSTTSPAGQVIGAGSVAGGAESSVEDGSGSSASDDPSSPVSSLGWYSEYGSRPTCPHPMA